MESSEKLRHKREQREEKEEGAEVMYNPAAKDQQMPKTCSCSFTSLILAFLAFIVRYKIFVGSVGNSIESNGPHFYESGFARAEL